MNFNFNLKNLDGTPIEGANVGKVIAQALVQTPKGDAVKLFFLAQKLHAGEELELDPSDKDYLKTFIKDHETFTNLLKAQALALFE